MSTETVNSNPENLEKLIQHVFGVCGNKKSPLMVAVIESLRAVVADDRMNLRPLFALRDRIANHLDFLRFRTSLIGRVEGEWIVTNVDLEAWADLDLFGGRDYFPDIWHVLANDIGPPIREKRRWQTFTRYKERGLTSEHRKLLSRLIWDLQPFRCDGVCLYVQGKRPFGNSSRVHDMIEILGWEYPDEDKDVPDGTEEKCWELFDELEFAIQDVLAIPQ